MNHDQPPETGHWTAAARRVPHHSTGTRLPSLDRAALYWCVAILGLTILYPTVRLLVSAAGVWEWSVVLGGAGRRATFNTLWLSFACVGTSGIFGTALAFFIQRFHFPGRNLLAGMAYLPLVLPPLVGVLSFYYLIGPDGFLPRTVEHVLGVQLPALEGPWGILIIHTYSFYVFFYAMVSAALATLDSSLLEAARTLGAGRWRVFTRITLPLLRPALIGAALLTFMSSGASFSAPYFFGGDFPMLSVQIYQERQHENHAEAVTLTVVLAAVALCGLFLFRGTRQASGQATKGAPRPLRHPAARLLAGCVAWAGIFVLLAPHLTIAWLSFADHRSWHEQIVPVRLTLENYVGILSNPSAIVPIRNSLWMSAVAAAATFAVAVPAAYLIGRRRPGGRRVNLLVMIPWALPGTVIAINLILAFNDPWLRVYDSVWMLPLAYFVRNVPLLTRMASAAIESFDASLLEAGRTLGASRWYCVRHIAAPLLAPSLAAATAFVFALSLGEFVASILLYLPSNIPISIQINMEWRGAGVGAAFAYSMLLMLLVGITFVVSRRFSQRVV